MVKWTESKTDSVISSDESFMVEKWIHFEPVVFMCIHVVRIDLTRQCRCRFSANKTLVLTYWSRRKWPPRRGFSAFEKLLQLQRAKAEPMFTLVLLLFYQTLTVKLSISTLSVFSTLTGNYKDSWSLMTQRYHVRPTALYYWLTNFARSGTKCQISYTEMNKTFTLDLSKFLK